MKRMIALAMGILLLACAAAGLAEADAPIEARTLREGRYIVGEDIEPGTYTLTCTGTAGEQMKDAYGALGDAMDALDGGQGYGSVFGAFGSVFETVADMTVEIVGDYGDVLKTWTMKTGDAMTIELEGRTALRITDGSCTIAAAEQAVLGAGR